MKTFVDATNEYNNSLNRTYYIRVLTRKLIPKHGSQLLISRYRNLLCMRNPFLAKNWVPKIGDFLYMDSIIGINKLLNSSNIYITYNTVSLKTIPKVSWCRIR